MVLFCISRLHTIICENLHHLKISHYMLVHTYAYVHMYVRAQSYVNTSCRIHIMTCTYAHTHDVHTGISDQGKDIGCTWHAIWKTEAADRGEYTASCHMTIMLLQQVFALGTCLDTESETRICVNAITQCSAHNSFVNVYSRDEVRFHQQCKY